MRWIAVLRARARAMFRRGRLESELHDELQYHLDRQIEALRTEGLADHDARQQALKDFGRLQDRKEECQDAWGVRAVDALLLDARFAVRSLRRTPLLTATVVVSLALGIGSIVAVFSLLDAVTLRPLAVPQAQQLITLGSEDEGETSWPQPVWKEIRDRGVIDDAFAWYWTRYDTTAHGPRRLITGIAASGGTFEALRIRPALGRLLSPSDDQPVPAVVNISYGYWQREFGGADTVIGRTLQLNGANLIIVGVLPATFSGLNVGLPLDVVVPLGTVGAADGAYLTIAGRLRPQESMQSLSARLQSQQDSIRKTTNPYDASPYREEYMRAPLRARSAERGVSFLESKYGTPLRVLFVIVGLVVLMASANLALVLAARAVARGPELASRLALGATPRRLGFELATEGVLLSGAGAVLAALFARWWCSAILADLSNQLYKVTLDLTPDWRVLAFASLIALVVATVFSALPVAFAMRLNPVEGLSGRTTAPRRVERRLGWLVVGQVPISLILVVLTGLFLRTYGNLVSARLGLQPDGVLICTIHLPDVPQDTIAELAQRIEAAAAVVPGVAEASRAVALPAGQSALTPWVELANGTALPQGPTGVYANRVAPGWFGTLGTHIVAGRDFRAADRVGAPRVAVVNESFVARFLDGKAPIGTAILERRGPDGERDSLEIVGVVEDAMYRFVKEPAPPTVYTPIDQLGRAPATFHLTLRASGETPAAALLSSVATSVEAVDPRLSLEFRTLEDQIGSQYARERLLAQISGVCGVIAIVLPGFGLYGLTAYSVAWRRQEIAIRMALGADRVTIVRSILTKALWRTTLGIGCGLAVALWLSRLVVPLLYGVHAADLQTFVGAGLLLLSVALLAAWLPARRASFENPATALKRP